MNEMHNRMLRQEQVMMQLQQERAQQVQIHTPRNEVGASSSGGEKEFALVDTRTLGKPEIFKGDSSEFGDWSFIFKSYISCIDMRYADLLERCEQGRNPMVNRAMSPLEQNMSSKLYFILVMLLRNRALDIVYNCGVGEGFEAYRRLYEQYHPRVASRYVGSLSLILATRFGQDLEAELEGFDKTIRRYEMESGKTIDEEMLLGIVVNGVQDQSIRDHIIRNSSRLNTYKALRDELLEMARTNRVLQQMPVAMEIGATPYSKKGKGVGKDPNGKGKDKGGKKGKGEKGGKPKGSPSGKGNNPHADKECRYCHKMGHIKADCRKRLADEAKDTKGKKGSGKPRTHAAAPDQEPEPASAMVDLIAGVVPRQQILVDTGAGNHLFPKGFDKYAVNLGYTKEPGMVTVTGEPLATGLKKRSVFKTQCGKRFAIEYNESDQTQFSVMSASRAASKGTWTIIGPNHQCLVMDENATGFQELLEKVPKISLVKDRGVFWLLMSTESQEPSAGGPAMSSGTGAGGPAWPIAGVKAAKKAIPASFYRDEPPPAVEGEVDVRVDADPEGLNLEVGEGDPEQPQVEVQDIPLGEPPTESSESSRAVRSKRIPETVSRKEFDEHMLTHIPFRSWCDHCCAGKVREDDHKKRNKEEEHQVARISMDYCFLGRVTDNTKGLEASVEELKAPTEADGAGEGVMPVLVIIDERTGCIFSGVVAKGVKEYALHLVTEALKFCGRQKVILMTDGEHSIKALAQAAGQRWNKETQIITAPRESHASNGAAERAILEVSRQVRTLVNAFEARYPKVKMSVSSLQYGWVVRHAGWLLTRYNVKTDGKSPYERLRGREFKGEVVEPFEVVHFKLTTDKRGKLDSQTAVGIWLGKSLQSDERYIGTSNGVQRCRSIWRRPEAKRWDPSQLEKMKGEPWQPRGTLTMVPGTPATGELPGAVPGTPGRKQRSVYITVDRQIQYGMTDGCPGCHSSDADPKRHNAECKARFEKLITEEQTSAREKAAAGGPAPSRPAGGPAEMAADGPAPMPAGSPAESAAGGTAPMSEAGGAASDKKRDLEPSESTSHKKTKGTSAQGTKREAETEIDTLRGEEDPRLHGAVAEVMAGMPTLHEDVAIAAYPEWGKVDDLGAYDERTGVALPLDKVKKARGRELDKMNEHGVKKDITWAEAKAKGYKIVRSRWVDGFKPLPDDPEGVRSRCVAQEVNTHQRDDVYSGTPPLKAHRMVISAAATKRNGQKVLNKLVARYDISVAFFHAMSKDKIAVVPPADVNDGEHVWQLFKAMNGTREASKRWAEFVDSVLTTKGGFHAVKNIPRLFYQDEWQVTISCHGDDFLAEGQASDLDRVDELMVKNFETKVLPRIGDPQFGGQCDSGTHLHRVISWTPKGFSWEADPKYARLLVEEFGLKGCKGVDNPASKDTGKGDRHVDKALDEKTAASFRRLAGTALYLSLDRPSIQYAMSEISSGMASPTHLHMLRLKRLCRYLAKYPREVWYYDLQEEPTEYHVYTDSD